MGLFWYMDLYRYMGFQDKLKLEFMDLDSIYKIKNGANGEEVALGLNSNFEKVVSELNLKVVWTPSPTKELPNRKIIELKNGDMIVGYNVDNTISYNLAMINRWGIADYGSSEIQFNINSSVRPTIQLPGVSGEDAEQMAFLSDIPDKGKFLSEEDLRKAYPVAKEGNYADVSGVVWIWHDGDWMERV